MQPFIPQQTAVGEIVARNLAALQRNLMEKDPRRISIVLSAIEEAWRKNDDLTLMELITQMFHDDGADRTDEEVLQRILSVYSVPDPRRSLDI